MTDMQVNTIPKSDMSEDTTGCCPRFDPRGWDSQTLHFRDQLCVRATTKSALHIPINMGRVFTRVQENIEDADAQDPDSTLVLSRALSPWLEEHYFLVTKPVEGEEMVKLSGDFMTRVFEGPYSKVRDWMHEMETAAKAHGHDAKRVFMFYTTCPKCAKAYGENYVVGVAEI